MTEMDEILAKGEKGEINPFNLLGVDPWVLKSLDFSSLKRFLGDFRKIVGRYHHPDLFQDAAQREKHQRYFALASGAIDKLLENDFYFRQSLDELRSGDILQRLRGEHSRQVGTLEEALAVAEKQIERIGSELTQEKRRAESIESIFGRTKEAENYLWNSNGMVPLVPSLKARMSFFYFYSPDLMENVDKLSKTPINAVEFEKEAIQLGKDYSEQFLKAKEESAKKRSSPLYTGQISGNRVKYKLPGRSELVEAQILGTLTYNGLIGYSALRAHDSVSLQSSLIFFEFSEKEEDVQSKFRNQRFLSNLISPYSLVIVKELKNKSRKKVSYHAFMPTALSDVSL